MDIMNAYLAYNFVMNDQLDVTGEAVVEDDKYWDNDESEEDTYDDFCGLLRRTDAEFAIIDPLTMGKEWDEYWDTLKETGNSNKIKIFRLDRYSVDELIETLKCWYSLE